MAVKNKDRWFLSKVGIATFVLAAILNLIIGPNIPAILGFLTSAIILTLANIVYVFYTDKKSMKRKKQG
jgi:uncharacterized membrane protein (DUF106 family)